MAVDMFLKIDGVTGESTDKGHEGWIEVMSFSWGATNAGSSGRGGGGAGKVQFQDFHFVKRTDKSSPVLLNFAVTGKSVPAVQFAVRPAGANLDYLRYKLADVLISSYQTGGNSQGESVPSDEVSLKYRLIDLAVADLRIG
jgi:type VI secretion system secreted protein Hcp